MFLDDNGNFNYSELTLRIFNSGGGDIRNFIKY